MNGVEPRKVELKDGRDVTVRLAESGDVPGLYESLGFEREGLRRRLVRLSDGTYVDDVLMALLL